MDIDLKHEFSLKEGLVYLNHAAVGVWPRRTAQAVKAFAEENMVQGAADYPSWLAAERRIRERLKRLINAESADDIALVKNTSEGLSLIAFGIDWQPGDNIVSTDQEFPSNRMPWESLTGKGVELRLADISGDDPEAAMLALCDERTRLLTVSSVQYGTGLRMQLKTLGEFCRREGILFCVDAIQSLGALCFDLAECQADFVVADGHKWLLGPEGLALFYSRPEAREQLRLVQYGWHMVEHAGDFDRFDWQPADAARRFEPGSPNMLGIFALDASLSLFEDVGMKQVEKMLLANAAELIGWVQDQEDLQLVTPAEAERHAGIVTFRHRKLDAQGHTALYRSLMKAGVICAHRAGGIRLSPHFYSSLAAFFPVWQRLTA